MRLYEIRERAGDPAAWNDPKALSLIYKEIKAIKGLVAPIDEALGEISYLEEISTIDKESIVLVEAEIPRVEAMVEKVRARATAGPDDDKPAFVTIQAGSGGREAMEWARMLLRMYDKSLRRHGMEYEEVYLDSTDDGGIRQVTIKVLGPSFGLLKAEAGIHRLSRVSPFDHADRRQTSFAKVEVIPESEMEVDDADIEIQEEDIDVSTCCGGGKGGQAINKTECVVRIKHHPTGIMVRCQDGRGQSHNRKVALSLLKSKLASLARQKLDEKKDARRVSAPRASFGAKYRRTYVLSQHPMIHDHLNDKQTPRTQDVLDGDLSMLA